MLGINGGEALVLLLIALVVVGPERLPRYAEQLAGQVRGLRRFLQEARVRVQEELGEDDDGTWASLDPRQYDPRRIVREALVDPVLGPAEAGPSMTGRAAAAATSGAVAGATGAMSFPSQAAVAASPGAAPFDDEAT